MSELPDKTFTIVNPDLLAAGPSLHYVSGTLEKLRMENAGYHPKSYASLFVVVPVPDGEVPTIAFGCVGPDRDSALKGVSEGWARGIGKHDATVTANAIAVGSYQQDLAQDVMAQAQAYSQRLEELVKRGDPLVAFLLEMSAGYLCDLMHLLGATEFNPTLLAVVTGVHGGYIRAEPGKWTTYLRDSAANSVHDVRTQLYLYPNKAN